MKEHSHCWDDPWMFPDGCTLCLAQDTICAYAMNVSFADGMPPWVTPELLEQDVIGQIDLLYRHHGIMTGAEMAAALRECY